MKPLSAEDIARAVGGILHFPENSEKLYDIFINDVCTDTRKIKKGNLFIPLKGENFDGHNFIKQAYENGAVCVLSEKNTEELSERIWIEVTDTSEALKSLAEYYRGLFPIPVVAITGSTGKTTTKDIIASVLSQKYNTLKTEGNYNNEIGVPLTVFGIDENTEVAVIEMGMNHFGEIHNLSKIGKPDIAVITNVGVSHIENLGSREGILKAKCEIFDFMDENSLKVLNGDDDMLSVLVGKEKSACFYGLENKNNEVYAENIVKKGFDGTEFTVNMQNDSFRVYMPVPGIHNVYNSLAAAAVGRRLGLTFKQISDGIESFSQTKMRMDIIKKNGYTIINDVYNANPASVKAAVDVISEADGRNVCILGDMFELGEFAPKLHFDIGKYVFENKNIDVIVCIGVLSENMYKGAETVKSKNQKAYYFTSQEEFFGEIFDILKKDDNVLVKASRGMNFEKTIEKILR